MKPRSGLTQFIISFVSAAVLFTSSMVTALAETDYQQWQAWVDKNPSWGKPVEPFQVIGNVYYVGMQGLASYLITSEDGHVLLDGGLPQNAKPILKNVESLGFRIEDIQVLLNSHAHFDHSGGLAEIKQVTGARLIASQGDQAALETGLYPGSSEPYYAAPPVGVDQVVADAEQISLGNIVLTAHITPGHSPGCTSWRMSVKHLDEAYDTLFFCSATVAGNRLVGPPQYPGIVDDYRRTFEITKGWQPDVFLANHPEFFKLSDKREAQRSGEVLAFVDRTSFPMLMRKLEASFEAALKQQKASLNTAPPGGSPEGADQNQTEKAKAELNDNRK